MSVSQKLVSAAKALVERFPRVAMTYRYLRDNHQSSRPPSSTPMGFNFAGNAEMEAGTFEPDETRLVRTLLPHVDVFIDIGANIGYYCCIALQAGRRTVAFEPVAANLQRLFDNVRANHWEHSIEIFPMALCDRPGIVNLFGGGTGASLVEGWAGTPAYYASRVAATTLDLAIGARFHGSQCFILVDVEGAEELMLRGATSLLTATPKPVWMVEIAVTEHQPAATPVNPRLMSTFDLFLSNGYEAFAASRTPRRVLREEVAAAAAAGRNTLGTHNFLFIAPDASSAIRGIVSQTTTA